MAHLPSDSRVALVAGGFSYEQDSITKSTDHVLAALTELGYVPMCFRPPFDAQSFRSFEPVTSLIVDPYFPDLNGEIHDIRKTINALGYRYTGSTPQVAAICRDKAASKEYFAFAAVRTPEHFVITRQTDSAEISSALLAFRFPVILKPMCEGSGVGVHLCSDYESFTKHLATERVRFSDLLLEEYIPGIDSTVTVMGHGEKAFSLVPVEIELRTGPIYDYDTKRGDAEMQHIPARFVAATLDNLRNAALIIHNAIGCRGLSRVDFRVAGSNLWCLEINSSPALGKHGNLPRAWQFERGQYCFLIDYLLQDSLEY